MTTKGENNLSNIGNIPPNLFKPKKFVGPQIIRSSLDKKYVFDIPNSSKDEGIELQIFSYHGEINQQFLIENVGISEYVIRALVSNKVLEVKGKELGEKNVIQVFQTNEESQLWSLEETDDGGFYIRSILGYYLDINNKNTYDQEKIIITRFHGGPSQKFFIENSY